MTENICFDLDNSVWCYLPESILIQIFKCLDVKDLVTVGVVCKSWYRISLDEFVWKHLFKTQFKTEKNVGLIKGNCCHPDFERI